MFMLYFTSFEFVLYPGITQNAYITSHKHQTHISHGLMQAVVGKQLSYFIENKAVGSDCVDDLGLP